MDGDGSRRKLPSGESPYSSLAGQTGGGPDAANGAPERSSSHLEVALVAPEPCAADVDVRPREEHAAPPRNEDAAVRTRRALVCTRCPDGRELAAHALLD